MLAIRKLLFKPKVDDWSPLARFFYADEDLNIVAAELDALDGRKNPERCQVLVSRLRSCQEKVLRIVQEMLVHVFPDESDRATRDYRVKFPDDILQDNLAGQLWYGAECLAAGSNIIDREFESEALRPLARKFTANLDQLRDHLKEQSLRDPTQYTEKVKSSLLAFDNLLAEFEYNYVCAMVPVKSAQDYETQQEVAVLFSEALNRAVNRGYIRKEQIEDCDPSIMITLPRLAIIAGLVIYPDGPLCLRKENGSRLPDMFRPFQTLLVKIRDLLASLSKADLEFLERSLCDLDDPKVKSGQPRARQRKTKHFWLVDISGCNLPDKTWPLSAAAVKRDLSGLLHRLFVCVSGVADQLQSNYAADLRAVLKILFSSDHVLAAEEVRGQTARSSAPGEELGLEARDESVAALLSDIDALPQMPSDGREAERRAHWVNDEEVLDCQSCGAPFSFIRRRHHCRSCGSIFCGRCSGNEIPLVGLGYTKPVRVCNQCFFHELNCYASIAGPVSSS